MAAWLWLQTNASAVYEHGVFTGVIGVSRDVTERMAADIALRRGQGRGGGRQPRQGRIPGQRQPRDPHADERRAGRPCTCWIGENISPEGRELMRRGQ